MNPLGINIFIYIYDFYYFDNRYYGLIFVS